MMTIDEPGKDPIQEEVLHCSFCTEIIDKVKGYYHVEITDWFSESEGCGEDFYYHRECYRQRQELLHANDV